MRRTPTIGILLTLIMLAAALCAPLSPASADPTASSPAGPVTGVIIVLSPAPAASPVAVPSPRILTPRTGLITPALPTIAPPPVLPSILVLAPTPATGSLVVPFRVPPVGSGPSLTQLQLVIPGPNPYQNTPIDLAQLLNSVLASLRGTGTHGAPPSGSPALPFVTVF